MVGAIAGAAVGLLFVLAPWAWGFLHGTIDIPATAVGPVLAEPMAIVLAGAVGGAIMGPSAWRARTFADWARAVCALAAVAIPIGAVVVGEAMAIGAAALDESWSTSTLLAPLIGLFLAAFGTLILGLFVLPFTVGAALIWAIVTRLVVPSIKARP
jgi:hypothetical protein